MIVQRQLFYFGRVQGVGFRYTVKQLATGYEVTGWVGNLGDGRVELQVKGEQAEVERFLAAIASGQLQHHIRERQEGAADSQLDEARTFEIRH